MIPFALAHFFPGLGFLVLAFGYSMRTSIELATYGRLSASSTKKQNNLWMPFAFMRGPCADSYLKLAYNTFIFIYQIFVEIIMYKTTIVGVDDEHVRAHNVTFWYKTGFYTMEYDLWELIYRNRPHLLMYFGFALGAFVELLIYYGEPMPKKTDKALMVAAFLIESFVFSNHTHGRDHIDAQIHVLLGYAVNGCVLLSAIEIWADTNAVVQYAKCFFIFLQSTWFFQMIFMLYWPANVFGEWTIFKWDLQDPKQIANLTFIFGLHMVAILTALIVQIVAIRRYYAYRGWNISYIYDSIQESSCCSVCKCDCGGDGLSQKAKESTAKRIKLLELSSEGDDSELLVDKA